jgi:hypothetical protein
MPLLSDQKGRPAISLQLIWAQEKITVAKEGK